MVYWPPDYSKTVIVKGDPEAGHNLNRETVSQPEDAAGALLPEVREQIEALVHKFF